MTIFRRLSPLISPRAVFVAALTASSVLLLLALGELVVLIATPRAAARPVLALPTPAEAAQAIGSRHLFGRVDSRALAGAAGQPADAAIRVLGLASSGPRGGGFAILSVDGKPPVPVVDGQEFAPGLRLKRVTATGIEYERAGVALYAGLQRQTPTDAPGAGNDGLAPPSNPSSAALRPRALGR